MKFYEELFEPFNKNKHKFHKKIYKTKKIDVLIGNIIDRIKKHNDKETKVVFKNKPIKNYNNLNDDLLKSNFVPTHIQSSFKNIKVCYTYEFTINNVKITVNFLLTNDENVEIYNNYIQKIILWLKVAYSYANNNKKTFLLNIFLSESKKTIPKNETVILGPKHCNTAVTYACATNGQCLIYRKEEWFKVLIHETMHALCLDFSGFSYNSLKNKVKKIFPIKSDFEVSETYSELWATIINNILIAFSISNDKVICIQYFHSLMQLEIYFALFQMVKILDYMNIYNYEYLFSKSKSSERNVYKENTNVFSYYILKSVILFNYVKFISFCNYNNDDIINFNKNIARGENSIILNKFFTLIVKCYKDKDLIKSYNTIKTFYNSLKKNKYYKLLNTMRMTSVEY